MNAKEAIQIIKSQKIMYEKLLDENNINSGVQISSVSIKEIVDACEAGIKALEKQVPKKLLPCYTVRYCQTGKCPVCEQSISKMGNMDVDYCYRCGQALDWKDKETEDINE